MGVKSTHAAADVSSMVRGSLSKGDSSAPEAMRALARPSGSGFDEFGRSGRELDRRSHSTRLRRLGQFNAASYIGGSAIVALAVTQIPGGVSTQVHVALAAGFLTGIVCLVLPWDRLPRPVLHLPSALASTLLAVSMANMEREASLIVPIFTLNSVVTAYWYASRRGFAAQLAYAVLAMVVGLALADGVAFAARTAIVAVPAVALAGLLVALMTEQLRVRKRAYRLLSELDPVTGIANRRALVLRIEEEVERHGRLGQPFALLLLDLDGFKSVNERFGHMHGDEFLRTVATTLRHAVRAEDLIARHGGDEFALLAPGLDLDRTAELASRVAAALARVDTAASIGFVVFPDHGFTVDELLHAADQAERAAKRSRFPGSGSRLVAGAGSSSGQPGTADMLTSVQGWSLSRFRAPSVVADVPPDVLLAVQARHGETRDPEE